MNQAFGVRKIVSGGQTGADRAALDFALRTGIETGGFVPKNRQAEDGRIPDVYPNLTETETAAPAERTGLNILASDATLIVSHGALKGGSELTARLAACFEKPFLHVDLRAESFSSAVERTRRWLETIDCRTLNVAGARLSEDPMIYAATRRLLEELFGGDSKQPAAE